ncbi:hypothetical protein KKA47_05400 [bacterium]|nr:hypothetical protein [bacterium]
MAKRWTREETLKVIEYLLEKDYEFNHPILKKVPHDLRLALNQYIRYGTNNLAYRAVDFDIESLSDEEFWRRIDEVKYSGTIENNAAATIIKMAEKFKLSN